MALRKCKNDCKILKIILVPDFCPLKPEILLDFLSDFVLMSFAFETNSRISLSFKLVPVKLLEYTHSLILSGICKHISDQNVEIQTKLASKLQVYLQR